MNSIDDVIALHSSKGNIEDGYLNIHFDENILTLNIFTLSFTSQRADKGETERWNRAVNEEIRKDKKLIKEIKEFRLLFEILQKLRIKTGYIEKMERPDFVLSKDGKTFGIEMTQVYSGNEWAVEKIREDIKNYSLEGKEVEGYIEYRKYQNKIHTFKIKENLVIKAKHDKGNTLEYTVKMKNKIFEKVRKMFDEYHSYDVNIVMAKIMSPEYFEDIADMEAFEKDLEFFVSHLEVDTTQKEYILLIKHRKKLYRFNISKKEFGVI